jgi:transposase-like protein
MAAGRPTKWNPETMLPILDQCAEEGMFRYEVARALGITHETLLQWEKQGDTDPDFAPFSEAIKRVDNAAIAILEAYARKTATGQTEAVNPSILIFTLKNKNGWRDRQEVEQTVKGDATIIVNLGGARSAGELDGGDA